MSDALADRSTPTQLLVYGFEPGAKFEGRLVGASAIGPISKVAREVRVSEMLIARQASPDPALLADPAAKRGMFVVDARVDDGHLDARALGNLPGLGFWF